MTDEEHELGRWLAAALDDASVCQEMKTDIARWFKATEDRGTLRDLASKIDRAARTHSCYSQAHEIVANCINHLRAVARVNEQNLKEARRDQDQHGPTG